MKRYSILSQSILAILVAFCLGACTSDGLSELEETLSPSNKHTMKMKFVGNVIGFDQQKSSNDNMQTKAITSSWNDGDKIYITFYNGSTIVPGVATYSSTSDWSVSYDGNLAVGSNLKCEARYFVNVTSSNSTNISLDSNTEIYEEANASYDYVDGTLTIAAILSPKTGRIRFKGTPNNKIHTTGIAIYSSFDPASNAFSSSKVPITSVVESNGYTPYIYGYFPNNEQTIGIIGDDFAFTRNLTSNMYATGKSGCLTIPSESSHNNWRSGLCVKANGVEFKMIPIVGYSGGFFMMAETETTEALYKSVNGTTSTSQLPIDSISYLSIASFIEKLNNETLLNFSLPTAEQWEYAAKGGNKSQGYTYAGNDAPDYVAWYSANCSSRQIVKTKAPNEIGLYDMSGNVGEFVSTMYDSSYPYIYGGSYRSTVYNIETTSWAQTNRNGSCYALKLGYIDFSNCTFDSTSCYSRGAGFRLALTFTD